MAIIRTLKEEELVGNGSAEKIYPVTTVEAIYDPSGKRLDETLEELENEPISLEFIDNL